MKTISPADFLTEYRRLNSLYSNIIDNKKLSYSSQCTIVDFYNKYKDSQDFDKMMVSFLLSADNEKQNVFFKLLHKEIDNNIKFYLDNKDFFLSIDILEICRNRTRFFEEDIEYQLKETRDLGKELRSVRHAIEAARLKNEKVTVERLSYKEDKVNNLYKEEKRKLDELIDERRRLEKEAAPYSLNKFQEIYELSLSFSSILHNYISIPSKEEPVVKEAEPVEKEEYIVTEEEYVVEEPIKLLPEIKFEPKPIVEVKPDLIFKSKMFEKFLILEKRLIKDGELDNNFHWLAKHKNDKPDIRRLVVFILGLMDNNYFLPRKDAAIKAFFESRYHIKIGQNFERKRREEFIKNYKTVFCEYPF